MKLVLASASERRKNILNDQGYVFDVVITDTREVFYANDPGRTARENAAMKNEWCRQRMPDCKIISADTVLEFEGRCVNKPASIEEARDFLRTFSGKTHRILTAVAVSEPGLAPELEVLESSVVFKTLDDEIIEEYFSRVNPLDKAGAYDIDQHGDLIIESYSGSYTNIMGLPEEVLEKL